MEVGEVILDRPVEVHAERSPPAATGAGRHDSARSSSSRAEVERLDREGRIVELAAMLGGGPGDAAALASARELLDRAESWRPGPVAAGGDRSA